MDRKKRKGKTHERKVSMIFDLLAIGAIIASIVWLLRSAGIAPVVALIVSLIAFIVHVVWDYRRRKAQDTTVVLLDTRPFRGADPRNVDILMGRAPGEKKRD